LRQTREPASHAGAHVVLGGRYELERTVEVSRWTARILGWDNHLGRRRTITVLRPGHAKLEPRFVAAAQRASAMSHPGLERVLDLGKQGSVPFVVRDWLAGSIGQHVKLIGTLPSIWAARVLSRCADSLGWLHSQGMAHGTVRPDTVFFAEDGEPVITDIEGTAHTLSREFATAHIAPEVLAGEPATPQSDLYSLGALLFTVVVGRPEPRLRYATVYEELLSQVHRRLREPIARVTSERPADRGRDAYELRDELNTLSNRLPPGPSEPPWAQWLQAGSMRPDLPPNVSDPILEELAAALSGLVSPRPSPPPPASDDDDDGTGNSPLPYTMPDVRGKALPLWARLVVDDETPSYADEHYLERLEAENRETVEGHARLAAERAMKPPPPPEFPIRAIAAGIGVVFGLLFLVFGIGSSVQATIGDRDAYVSARENLHATMDLVPDTFGFLSREDRDEMEALYLAYIDQPTEPARTEAAMAVLRASETHAPDVELADDVSMARERYERAARRWHERSTASLGALWLALGAVAEPTRHVKPTAFTPAPETAGHAPVPLTQKPGGAAP